MNRSSSIQIRRAKGHDAAGIEDIVVVAERGSALVGWAKAGPYTDRHYYDGVREATLYVAREARRIGVGHALLERLAVEAAGQGAHKLVGKVFSSNDGSIALLGGLGWREVGVHHRHGELDGEWKDVLVVEKLLVTPD